MLLRSLWIVFSENKIVPSPPAQDFEDSSRKAMILRKSATKTGVLISPSDGQIYYHSALALLVAAWEAYIENLTRVFISEIADPLNIKYLNIHNILSDRLEDYLKRFNTPSFENSRNLLVNYTGYDPIGDWVWTARRMNAVATRERLNEILKVRHSFAHGFSIPSFSWTQSPSGQVRLTASAIDDVNAFLRFIVKATDNGMKKYIRNHFGINTGW